MAMDKRSGWAVAGAGLQGAYWSFTWLDRKYMWNVELHPVLVVGVFIVSLMLIAYGLSPLWEQARHWTRRIRRVRLRSPFFISNQPSKPAEPTSWQVGGWTFRKPEADGGRVLVHRNGSSYRIMEADAYEYFEKLSDAEKIRIVERWGWFRSVYWLKHRAN